MEKERYTTTNRIRTEQLADSLKKLTSEECILVEKMENVDVIVLEKYYLRNGSYASCTICIDRQEASTEIVVICSGAGEGVLNMSWGATGHFLDKVGAVIQEYL